MTKQLLYSLAVAAATVASLVFTTAPAHAAVISIPTSNVTASSEIPPGFTRFDDHLVDGSGLSGGQHGIVPDGSMWLTANTDADPWVQFDLGAVHTINSLHVWNYNEVGAFTTRGVKNLSVQYGTTAGLGSTLAGVSQFAQATGAATYTGEDFNSFTPFDARFIKFDIANGGANDGNWGNSETYYGLSEVQFDGTSTAPTLITGVTVANVSSELIQNFDRDADFLVDGGGLNVNGAGTHSTLPDGPAGNGNGTMWLNTGTTNCCGGTSYVNSPGAGQDDVPEVTFDLGDLYNVAEMRIWNYNEAGAPISRGVNEMEVLVSPDNSTFTSLGTVNLAIGPGVDNVDFSETFPLNANNVRYVKLDIISGHGGDNGFVGLSEVQFLAAPIPEPSTLALAALGLLGLLGWGRRRKR